MLLQNELPLILGARYLYSKQLKVIGVDAVIKNSKDTQ